MSVAELRKTLTKKLGEGSIRSVDELEKDFSFKRVTSTGSKNLDMALGTGGIPEGAFIQIHGHYTSGKSTLATEICRQFLRQKKSVVYIDVEQTMGLTGQAYFRKLGISDEEMSRLFLVQRSDIKDVVTTIEHAISI